MRAKQIEGERVGFFDKSVGPFESRTGVFQVELKDGSEREIKSVRIKFGQTSALGDFTQTFAVFQAPLGKAQEGSLEALQPAGFADGGEIAKPEKKERTGLENFFEEGEGEGDQLLAGIERWKFRSR